MIGKCFTTVLAGAALLSASARTARVEMADGEVWWGGANFFGRQMPFDASSDLTIDLRKDNYHNQGATLLLSNRGRFVWSPAQSKIVVKDAAIAVDADGEVVVRTAGSSLREAYCAAMRLGFPPKGRLPPAEFFTAPQLNTWIELTYHQNQGDILAYAKEMLAHGVPPGVLMIDDTWQAGYGDWRFEPSRFPDPKAMMDELHGLGFKVMLWMCPYVGMDLPAFRRIAWGTNPEDVRGYPAKGGFLSDPKTGEPKACRWWNGYSAFLDFSHPNANAWFAETLDGLVSAYGVDGFKFDGADLTAYDLKTVTAHDPAATNGRLERGYGAYALRYPYSEIRNTVALQQEPVVVRLHDKKHEWASLPRIVADMIGAGLLGYPFICPDMVGGGEWTSFIPGAAFDTELFIRSAQIHALCPMMQISASPWRVLSAADQAVFAKAVALRQKFAPEILKLAEKAARDGEPILRALEYNYPNRGYAGVRDEFMMGTDLLVAPVLEKGAKTRKVALPPGTWRADDGSLCPGDRTIEVSAPIDRLPYFIRTGASNSAHEGTRQAYGAETAPVTVYSQPGWCVWCPTPTRLADGRFALVHSRWPESCGFEAWCMKSEIALAVSDKALGPYRFVGTLLGGAGKDDAWDRDVAHNPYLFSHGGRYYLYYMGTRGTAGDRRSFLSSQRIGVAVADRVEGPWRRAEKPLFPEDPHRAMCSNPSVCAMPDGRILMVYKWMVAPWSTRPEVHLGAAVADRPEGPFSIVNENVFPAPGVRFAGEDPCLWVEGDTIVCVIHDMGTAYSPHSRALVRFESKDGVRWTNRGAILSRGGIHRLERPYVLSLPGGERLLFAASKPSAAGESSQVVAYPGLLPAKPNPPMTENHHRTVFKKCNGFF